MSHVRRAAVLAALLLSTTIAARAGLAQGIGVNAHSGCNSGRFEAVVADPCADGSAVWYNPAALAFEPSVIAVGAGIVRNGHTFQYNADPSVTYKRGPVYPLVPHAWLNYRINDRLAVGAGFWAPYGLTLKWDSTFPGRFGGYDNTVKAIYVQPTVAYQLVPKRVAIGAGLDAVLGVMDINMREDLATQAVPTIPGKTFNNLGIPFGTDFADLRLKGNKAGMTGHVAAMVRVTDQLSFGARYLMQTKIKFNSGTATFTPVATHRTLAAGNPFGLPAGTPLDALFASKFLADSLLGDQKVAGEVIFPAMAVVGVAFKPVPTVELSGDWQWTNWAKWDSITLHLENPKPAGTIQQLYLANQNTNTFRVGAQWSATPAFDLRGGWGYNNPAEKSIAVSPLLPEAKRNYYAVGLGYKFARGLAADGYFQYVKQADRQGRLYPLTGDQYRANNPDAVNVGLYTAQGTVFGATLRYTFGPAR